MCAVPSHLIPWDVCHGIPIPMDKSANHVLHDQFYVRIPVLVDTCAVSSNVKRNLVQK